MKDPAADARGSTAIEYALLGALISLVIITALGAVGTQLSTFFASITITP